MPVRNAARFVDAAIASILSQTFCDFEFIIIDDGSTDDSLARVRCVADRRVIVKSQAPGGIVQALNAGIAEARGVYIARMDADDIALPERLAKQLALIEADPDVSAVGGFYKVIDDRGRHLREVRLPTSAADIARTLLTTNCMAHPTMLLRREQMVAVGGYRYGFPMCEDYDLWLRLSEVSKLLNVPEPLLLYREHGCQTSFSDLEQRIVSEVAVLHLAALRRSGYPEPRNLEDRLPPDDRECRRQIRRRALLAATGAIGEGRHPIARAALQVALAQGPPRPGEAVHLLRLALRVYARRR